MNGDSTHHQHHSSSRPYPHTPCCDNPDCPLHSRHTHILGSRPLQEGKEGTLHPPTGSPAENEGKEGPADQHEKVWGDSIYSFIAFLLEWVALGLQIIGDGCASWWGVPSPQVDGNSSSSFPEGIQRRILPPTLCLLAGWCLLFWFLLTFLAFSSCVYLMKLIFWL